MAEIRRDAVAEYRWLLRGFTVRPIDQMTDEEVIAVARRFADQMELFALQMGSWADEYLADFAQAAAVLGWWGEQINREIGRLATVIRNERADSAGDS